MNGEDRGPLLDEDSESPTEGETPRAKSARDRGADAGRYDLRESLGKGGMGEVFAALDQVLGREVAIKRLLGASPSPLQVARFLREAAIQARLEHPAIPPLYELDRDELGRPFIVMRRLAGTTLADIFKRVDTADPEAVVRFPRHRLLRALADVCLAVEFAHTRGVLHRDLKPANFMLGEFGEVYVLDWGVAKVIGDADPSLGDLRPSPDADTTTHPGVVPGTPSYMAPEQLDEGELDGRADVYALGCVLFEILSGSIFHRKGRKAWAGVDKRPSRRAPDRMIPPELDELCAAALEGDRAARIQTARELGERIHHYLDGDRDLAQRRSLAADHFARARAALDTSAEQTEAMREAGRALALDPHHAEAAELVSRLMLEPPRSIPPEVEHAIAETEGQRGQHTARLVGFGLLGYASVLPFMAWIGIRDWTLPIALVFVLLFSTVLAVRTRPRSASRRVYLIALVINAMIVGIYARMFSPVLLAPTVACTSIMVLVAAPGYRGRYMIALVTSGFLAVIVPWAAELVGLLSPTMSFQADGLLLSSPTISLDHPFAIQVGLMVFVSSSIVIAALHAWTRFRAEASAQQRLHLQTWRLRQLAPLRTP